MLTKAEQDQVLVDFNDTRLEYPKDKTIMDLFEEQVLKAPDAVALAPSPPRTRSATQMRNAAVHPKGLIWASAVGTLRRSPN